MFRWACAIIWFLLVLVALLTPVNHVEIEDLNFSHFLATFFSIDMSEHEKLEAIVHLFLFAVLATTLYWALVSNYSLRIALINSVAICVFLGTSTEIAQYFIGRGSMFIDLLANLFGIFLSVVMIKLKVRVMR